MKKSVLILVTGLAIAGTLLLFNPKSQARVLPFQGRLTDANGNPLPDGARVVQFRMFDAPIGGAAVWAGEVQKVSVKLDSNKQLREKYPAWFAEKD